MDKKLIQAVIGALGMISHLKEENDLLRQLLALKLPDLSESERAQLKANPHKHENEANLQASINYLKSLL